MSGQVSPGSAGEYQADERAGVARLHWRVSGRKSFQKDTDLWFFLRIKKLESSMVWQKSKGKFIQATDGRYVNERLQFANNGVVIFFGCFSTYSIFFWEDGI